MMNWMQGHPLGREFKALVCHDGVFSMANQMSSDEQYFPNHDLGGPYYQAMETWQKWDASRFVGQWKTPMLVSVNPELFAPLFQVCFIVRACIATKRFPNLKLRPVWYISI